MKCSHAAYIIRKRSGTREIFEYQEHVDLCRKLWDFEKPTHALGSTENYVSRSLSTIIEGLVPRLHERTIACWNVKKQTISVICILSRKSILVKIYYTEKNRIKIPPNPA